jgi:3-hydroxyisobutyrate dehydrogenase-like beta-hydroxyacid dehydrogenase
MATIGFIGTGTIGGPMAAQLLEHGHNMLVCDRNPEALKQLVDNGALAATGIRDVAEKCKSVFLSLPGPPEIESVVLADDGLLAHLGPRSTIIDLSTNSVSLNRRIAEAAAKKSIAYLDAPVSGGKHGALKGALAIMIGGDEAAFNAARPLLDCIGENLFYMGPAGSGTLTKLVNNQIFLCSSVLIQEGFVMGTKAGMDPSALLEVLTASSAGPLMSRAPLFLSRKFDLDIFSLSIAAKDVAVALESGEDLQSPMPMTKAALGVYREAVEAGLSDEDFFATVKILEKSAGVEVPPLRKSKT